MAFTRLLNQDMAVRLNALYSESASWWRRLVDDPEVFIAVRPNNELNAYAGGGSVARVKWSRKSLSLRVHVKYLVFPDAAERPYRDLLAEGVQVPSIVVQNIDDYGRFFSRIKNAASSFQGKERRAESLVAARLSCIIDIEGAFSAKAEENSAVYDDPASSGRVDFVVVSKQGFLGAVELKIFSNAELRPRGGEAPAVCGQLVEYGRWLDRNRSSVLAAYRQVAACYRQLQGRFFEERRSRFPSDVDPIPRLLIVGFDKTKRSTIATLRHHIAAIVAEHLPGFHESHIVAVGNPQNVREHHFRL